MLWKWGQMLLCPMNLKWIFVWINVQQSGHHQSIAQKWPSWDSLTSCYLPDVTGGCIRVLNTSTPVMLYVTHVTFRKHNFTPQHLTVLKENYQKHNSILLVELDVLNHESCMQQRVPRFGTLSLTWEFTTNYSKLINTRKTMVWKQLFEMVVILFIKYSINQSI